jgi:hypothetical protein
MNLEIIRVVSKEELKTGKLRFTEGFGDKNQRKIDGACAKEKKDCLLKEGKKALQRVET